MATTITRLSNNTHVQIDFDGQIGYQVDIRSSVHYNETLGKDRLFIYDAYTVLPSGGNTLLDLNPLDIAGRPSDNPKEISEWLAETFFFDNTQQQIDDLEATTFKITYFEIVDISVSAVGSITPPTGATIQANQFGESGNAVLSTLTGSNTPTFESPEDGGGSAITVSLDVNNGNYVASDLFAQPVALIYSFSIALGDLGNVDLSRAVDFYQVSAGTTLHSELTLDDGTNPHGTTKSDVGLGNVPDLDTTDAVANEHVQGTDQALDTGGANEVTAADARGHIDDAGIHVPSGGTTGQVLKKQSNADGDTDWEDEAIGGVQSVSGPDVDNTDPNNPIVNRTDATDVPNFDVEVENNTEVSANTTHRASDGKDHSDVVLNNAHRVSTSNPHGVTAAQTGAETTAELNARDAANRDRANHTGTQTASTISDFDAEVSNNVDVQANTAKVSADGSVTTHNDVTDAGSGAIITGVERSKLANIEDNAKDDQNASEVPFTPAGNIVATNVQAALEELDSEVNPNNGYTVFGIWAEENAALSNANRQWSFGNGATGPINIVVPIDAELFAISFDAELGPGTATIDIMKNDAVLLTSKDFALKDFELLGTPQAFVAGEYIGFQTNTVTGTVSDARVCAWFRIPSTPASTAVLNDLLDVSIPSPLSNQVLLYNGANWVAQAIDHNFTLSNLQGGQASEYYHLDEDQHDRAVRQFRGYFTQSYAASIVFDGNNGAHQIVTLTGDAELGVPVNWPDGTPFSFVIIQNSTGGHLLTYSSNFVFVNGEGSISMDGGAITIMKGVVRGSSFEIHSKGKDLLPDLHFGTFNDLALWWRLNEGAGTTVPAADSTGNGNVGVVTVTGVTRGVPAYFRTGYSLNGLSGSISAVGTSYADNLAGVVDWAVALRCSSTSIKGDFEAVFAFGDDDGMGGDTVALYPYSSENGMANGTGVWYNGSFIGNVDGGPAADGTMNHYLLLQRDANTVELWINGILVGTFNPADSIDAGTNRFTIGSFLEQGEYYDGVVDDVRGFITSANLNSASILGIATVPSF